MTMADRKDITLPKTLTAKAQDTWPNTSVWCNMGVILAMASSCPCRRSKSSPRALTAYSMALTKPKRPVTVIVRGGEQAWGGGGGGGEGEGLYCLTPSQPVRLSQGEGRQRERERERERQRQRQRERERERVVERETDRQTDRGREEERQTERQTDRDRDEVERERRGGGGREGRTQRAKRVV